MKFTHMSVRSCENVSSLNKDTMGALKNCCFIQTQYLKNKMFWYSMVNITNPFFSKIRFETK